MKKIISLFALVGLFALTVPKVTMATEPENCKAVYFYCGDQNVGIVVICDEEDQDSWEEILCG